jgi:23S rRNA (guanine745-N1)-methyltransferase
MPSVAAEDIAPPPLACTVRDCGEPLRRLAASYHCARGHTFDISRSGYVNLLQPQDRRSRHPGDNADAVAARSRLLAAGIGAGAVTAVARVVHALELGPRPVVVDLGCGGGELLNAIAASVTDHGPHPADRRHHGSRETLIGIDLSTAAIEAAARRFPAPTWVVANADRRLPVQDASVDVIVSLNGRRNPADAARALRPRGTLVIGVPAADDLIELRERVLGGRVERDRVPAVIDEHAVAFRLVERLTIRERQPLERPALLDLLQGTYRGNRTSHAARLESLATLDVTSAAEVLVFAAR